MKFAFVRGFVLSSFCGKYLFFLFCKCYLVGRRVMRRGFHGFAERHSDLSVGFSLGPFLCVLPIFFGKLLLWSVTPVAILPLSYFACAIALWRPPLESQFSHSLPCNRQTGR